MIEKKPPANLGTRMDFHPSEEAIAMGQHPGWKAEPVAPEKVGQTVEDQGVQARIAQYDLGKASRCRIPGKNCPNIFSQ
jgi:hypothetical protein